MTSIAERVSVCGARLNLPEPEIERIRSHLSREAPAEQAGAFQRLIEDKERLAYRADTTDARIGEASQSIRQYKTVKQQKAAAWRLLCADSNPEWHKANRVWISQASVVQTVSNKERLGIEVLDKHEKLLTGEGGLRYLAWQRGELPDADLSGAEAKAFREVRDDLVRQKSELNSAQGIPQHLDNGILLPQRVRAHLLAKVEGETLEAQSRNFAAEWLPKLSDDVREFFAADDAVRLRAWYVMNTARKDSLIDSGVAAEQKGLPGVADDEQIPIEAFWDLDRRPLEFADAATEMEFNRKYAGAHNVRDMLGINVLVSARTTGAALTMGNSTDKFRDAIVESLKEGGVPINDINDWVRAFTKVTGEINDLANASDWGQFLSGAANSRTTAALHFSQLTLLSGQMRYFLEAARTRGIFYGLIDSFNAFAKANPQMWNDPEWARVLDSVRLTNTAKMSNVLENAQIQGGATSEDFGAGFLPTAGATMARAYRKGVLKWGQFERIGEAMRQGVVIDDLKNTTDLLRRFSDYDKMPKRLQEYFLEGNIGKREWNAAVASLREGAVIKLGGRELVDFNRISDPVISNKWQGRSTLVADHLSGYAPTNIDTALTRGHAGTLTRAGFNAAFGLLRDPLSAGMQLLRQVYGIGQANPLEAMGVGFAFVGGMIMWAHARSQMAHIATYGEPHDYFDSRRAVYVGQLAAFAGAEIWGEYLVDNAWAEQHGAAIGGGPAFGAVVGAAHSITDLARLQEDSGIARFFADKGDQRARVFRDAFRDWTPLPGPVARGLAATIDPRRESLVQKFLPQ